MNLMYRWDTNVEDDLGVPMCSIGILLQILVDFCREFCRVLERFVENRRDL